MKVASWNVNGIRACAKSDLVPWLQKGRYDAVLLQEVRADESQIPAEVSSIAHYEKLWFPSTVKKGYSGVGILSKE